MKHLLTLSLLAILHTGWAQSEYCLDGTVWDATLGGCVPEVFACGFDSDLDGDGAVGSGDLLALLAEYGFVVVDDDFDGVCDEIDTCVGQVDECGVCNGPGAVYDCGCNECYPCGNPVAYYGHYYSTVLIGNQCWFAENLRNEFYANGEGISQAINDGAEWYASTYGVTAVFGQGEDICCLAGNDVLGYDACTSYSQTLSDYGRLYNWYAVNDERGLCPNGWHIPSFDEWLELINHLGGDEVAGGHMKTVYGWQSGGNGTNSSGFSGLAAGGFYNSVAFIPPETYCEGYFGYLGLEGHWWSSPIEVSPGQYGAYHFGLGASSEAVMIDLTPAGGGGYLSGGSVRCVADAE